MKDHPYDTPLSGGLRFAVELIAWVAGPWAAAHVALWLAVPAAAVLVGLPSVFSTRGDKRQVIVATPGPVRVQSSCCSTPWRSGRPGPRGRRRSRRLRLWL